MEVEMSDAAVLLLPDEVPEVVAPVVVAVAARPASPLPMADGRALGAAALGWVAAGFSAGLGAQAPDVAARSVPAGLMVGVGALVLTGPALVVGHQYLGLAARPVDLAAGLADGFVRSGRAALGFAPFLAFFALTTSLWLPMAVLVGAAGGLVALSWASAGLRRTESPSARMDVLLLTWGTLATLVALRLAVDVARAVLG